MNNSGPEKQKGASPLLSYEILSLRISSSFRSRRYKSQYIPSVTGLGIEQQSLIGARSPAKKKPN